MPVGRQPGADDLDALDQLRRAVGAIRARDLGLALAAVNAAIDGEPAAPEG